MNPAKSLERRISAALHGGNGRALTERQKQAVQLICSGMKNSEVAIAMGISEGGVKNQVSRIFNKLGVFNRVELGTCGTRGGGLRRRKQNHKTVVFPAPPLP